MSRKILMVLSFVLFSGIVFAGGPDLKEGLWEITVQMDMPGMPMQMPDHKFTQCITKEDMIPEEKEKDKDCKIETRKVSGNTVFWKVVCKEEEGTYTVNGKVTYRGDTFTGESEIKAPDMEMKQKMKGRWIGPCQKKK